jgi:uncharacterized phage-associated protein
MDFDGVKFSFSEAKALAALALIAEKHPGLTPLYVAKIMYFAERSHINRYGRPICADDYIAMPQGPVPSTIKNFIDQNWNWVQKPEAIEDAIQIDNSSRYARLMPGKKTLDVSALSETDQECICEAIEFCVKKRPEELSAITHRHAAWRQANRNRSMDYRLFVDDDNPHKDEIIEMLEENAICAVL